MNYVNSLGNSEFDFINTFPPLGHPEHHFNKYPNHPWLKTKDEIESWLNLIFKIGMVKLGKDRSITKIDVEKVYKIHEDLTVTVYGESDSYVDISDLRLKGVPVQFRRVNKFDCSLNELINLIGTPYRCNSLLANNNSINELKGVSGKYKELDLSDNNISDIKQLLLLKTVGLLKLNKNPIKNIEELSIEVDRLYLTAKKEDDFYKTLIGIKDSVNSIFLSNRREYNNFKLIKMKSNSVDMFWLRERQKKYKEIKDLNLDLKNLINVENVESKRKL